MKGFTAWNITDRFIPNAEQYPRKFVLTYWHGENNGYLNCADSQYKLSREVLGIQTSADGYCFLFFLENGLCLVCTSIQIVKDYFYTENEQQYLLHFTEWDCVQALEVIEPIMRPYLATVQTIVPDVFYQAFETH